jgi:hypothetical protein
MGFNTWFEQGTSSRKSPPEYTSNKNCQRRKLKEIKYFFVKNSKS